MQQVEKELKAQHWPADLLIDESSGLVRLEVLKPGQVEFLYEVRIREYAKPDFAYPERAHGIDDVEHYYRAEVFLQRGGRAYDIFGYSQQDIIGDILDQFEKYLHFLHESPGILPWNMDNCDDDLQERLHTNATDKNGEKPQEAGPDETAKAGNRLEPPHRE